MGAMQQTGPEERSGVLIEEEEEHDGWGPIRPRRSSMPPDMHAAADPDDPITMPVICTPLPAGFPETKR